MRKITIWSAVALSLMVIGLSGCGGPSATKDDSAGKGAEVTGFQVVEMEGGYIDQMAYSEQTPITRLWPWVELDRKSGMAGNMGFTLLRVINDREIFSTHAVRWLTVTKGSELRITIGGETVVLRAMEDGKRWHKNNEDSGGYRYTTYFEQVRYEIDAADMARFGSGTITRITAQGSKGGTAWPRTGKKMLPDFSTKVNAFYRAQIAPHM